MITRMSKYSFILLDSGRDEFIERLKELGVVDITRSAKPVDERSAALLQELESARRTVGEVMKYKTAQSPSRIGTEDLLALASGTLEETAALCGTLAEEEKLLASVQAWGSFSTETLQSLEAAGVKLHFYNMPLKAFKAEWAELWPLQEISRDGGAVWFVIAGEPQGAPKELARAETAAPQCTAAAAAERIAATKARIAEREAVIAALQARSGELESVCAGIADTLNTYLASVASVPAAENVLCTFTGFAPTKEDARLCAAFDEMDVIYVREDAKAEDNPPIKLHNNRFSALFETLTGMYGMPVYGEFDPTPVLSIFFMLFFAICMGDAGYGLILILFGIAEEKKWINVGMFSNVGKLIAVLGAATFVVGLFLGTFFGMSLFDASWVPAGLKKLMIVEGNVGRIAGYDPQMVMALVIGVLHICLAMTMKAVCYTRRFGFKETISTWGWTILVVGGVIAAAVIFACNLSPLATKIIIIGIAVVSGLGIFIFNKPGRNPLLNIGAGLWDTYSMVTGLLGDVLSYIRLYALGLAGGMLGGAFNDLAAMVRGAADTATWQWVPFVVILIIGHVLNLLMSCLGAFVHPLRLNFVEYFKNSGYEGRGVRYNPLKINQ